MFAWIMATPLQFLKDCINFPCKMSIEDSKKYCSVQFPSPCFRSSRPENLTVKGLSSRFSQWCWRNFSEQLFPKFHLISWWGNFLETQFPQSFGPTVRNFAETVHFHKISTPEKFDEFLVFYVVTFPCNCFRKLMLLYCFCDWFPFSSHFMRVILRNYQCSYIFRKPTNSLIK